MVKMAIRIFFENKKGVALDS